MSELKEKVIRTLQQAERSMAFDEIKKTIGTTDANLTAALEELRSENKAETLPINGYKWSLVPTS